MCSSIALKVQSSRNTVAAVIVAAQAAGVSWPLGDDITNEDISEILFPGKYAMASPYTVPDYEWIHRELAKMGVTLTLLWSEYCVKVRDSVSPSIKEISAPLRFSHCVDLRKDRAISSLYFTLLLSTPLPTLRAGFSQVNSRVTHTSRCFFTGEQPGDRSLIS